MSSQLIQRTRKYAEIKEKLNLYSAEQLEALWRCVCANFKTEGSPAHTMKLNPENKEVRSLFYGALKANRVSHDTIIRIMKRGINE